MKKVLFLCRENARHSRMAEAFAQRFGRDVFEASSAGTHPASEDDPMTKAVMKERGFEMGGSAPRGLGSLAESSFDICVHFGCLQGGVPPEVKAKAVLDWGDIEDPKGKPYSEYRKLREEIGRRVLEMIRKHRGAA